MMNNAEKPQLTIPRVIGSLSFFNADNLEIMRGFNDNEFDLAIVDPPYGMLGNGFSPTSKIKPLKGKKGSGVLKNENCKFKKVDQKYPGGFQTNLGGRPSDDYWSELFRVSKNQVVWGMQYFIDKLPIHNCVIVWDKLNGESRFSDAEIAWTSFDYGTRIIKQAPDRLNRIHPTQKPIRLYEKLFHKLNIKTGRILDTHLGSGSIAIAIEKANSLDKMNLEFVGIEIDKEYYEAALNRIEQYCRQGTLSF